MGTWLKALIVAAATAGLAGLAVVASRIPAAACFALAVSVACGWSYWLERKSGASR